MNIEADLTWLLAVILVSIRIGVVFFATPLDLMGRIPGQIRIFLTLVLGAVLVTGLDLQAVQQARSIFALAMLGLNELVVGLILAFGIYCVFGAIMVGGKLIDFQGGFGAASILNPATNSNNPVMGTVLSLVAILIFFVTNQHHLVVRGLAYSLEALPPGQAISDLNLPILVRQFGMMFTFGVVIAAPVIGALLLVDTGVAVMARTMPQMNVYFLFLPLKIFLVIVLTGVSLRFLSPLLNTMFRSIFEFWQIIL